MYTQQLRGLVYLLCLLLFATGCQEQEEVLRVNFEEGTMLVDTEVTEASTLKIVVGDLIPTGLGAANFQRLLDYVGKKINRKIIIVAQASYREINELLRSHRVTAAFVSGHAYVSGHQDFNLQLLVAPQINDETMTRSLLIVHEDSEYIEWEDLRGKAFAFADPLSDSGCLVPMVQLAKMKEEPDGFFDAYLYTYQQAKSIKAVARRVVDAAAVDQWIYMHELEYSPKYASKTRIIEESPPFAMAAFVVPANLPTGLKEQLRNGFLTIDKEHEGRRILRDLSIERFADIRDQAYQVTRQLSIQLANHAAEEQE